MKGIIFDMDGLILDSEKINMAASKDALVDLGYEYDKELMTSLLGKNDKGFYDALLQKYGEEFPFTDFVKAFEGNSRAYIKKNGVSLKEGVLEVLKTLKEKNIKIALGTSSGFEKAKHHLTLTGIIDYFDAIASGDMVVYGKPSPDIFLLACEKLGLEPKDCIVFEDSYNGIRAAKVGGFYAIMVPDILKPTDEIRDLADEVLDSLLHFDVHKHIKKEMP